MAVKNIDDQAIFEVARKINSPEARQAYLQQMCADDPALEQRIAALLLAYEENASFLESPPPELAIFPTLDQPPLEKPGTQIGPYKLLQQIGEGGMGVVYMAEQHEPVKRRVALKIIKPGMDTRQVIARFEAERQALSLMEHPYIAKVLDAGTTDSGRPYFVMELVKGQPITQYCDEHHLTPRQRLELLLPVCQAIQHAHQKGIIHRDIKPTNILVAEYDQQPVPKVIDFGVAKATSQALTEKTMFTGLGQIVGTLEYMSPEQAKVNQLDIDTRSDIYSLGVLLYELLTGSTPFDRKRLRSAAFDEMLRIIREEDPPKPSTRLSDLSTPQAPREESSSRSEPATLASIAALRQTEPAKLTKLVRGELDWIVMKALDKDRARRYESANAFAADLQNYLSDEPVVACPPSAAYRFAKFARRNKGRVAAAGVLALALLVAVSGIGWAVRDRSARQAEIARERSERQTRVTTQVELILADVDRLMREQKWDDAIAFAKRAEAALASGEIDDATREKVSDRVKDLGFVARLEQIRMSRAVPVDGKFDHAGSIREYRRAFREFGIDAEAEAVPEAIIRRLAAHGGIGVAVAAALDDWVESHRSALGLEGSGWQPLISLARQIDPDPWRDRLRTLWGQRVASEMPSELQKLAGSNELRKQPPGTLIVLAASLGRARLADLQEQVLRHAQSEYPGDFWVNLEFGILLLSKKLFDDANKCWSMALAVKPNSAVARSNLGVVLRDQKKLDGAIAEYRKAIELDPTFALAHNNLGIVLSDQKKLDEAIVEFRKAIELDSTFALPHYNLGSALRDQKKLDEAIACYRKALELDPTFANPHNNLGNALRDQKKLDEAIAVYRKAIELDPTNPAPHYNLGIALRDQKKLDEAIAEYRKAIEFDPTNTILHSILGSALSDQKKLDEAIVEFRKAIELDPTYAIPHNGLGNALRGQEKLDEAIAEYRKAIELDPTYAVPHNNLGIALFDQKKLDEAIAEYRKAIELDPTFAIPHNGLGRALSDQKKLDEAIAEYRKAIELDPTFANSHFNLGVVLYYQKKLDEAISEYRKAVELDPKNAIMHNNLGNALWAQEKLEEAISEYRKAVELDPKDAETLNNLAWKLTTTADPRLRSPEQGLSFARRAVAINPSWPNLDTQSLAAFRCGQWKESLDARRKMIELRPARLEDKWFLAMSHWHLGDKDEALRWHAEASAEFEKDSQKHRGLAPIKQEADQLIGTSPEPKETKQPSSAP